jgi:hypothetical protein
MGYRIVRTALDKDPSVTHVYRIIPDNDAVGNDVVDNNIRPGSIGVNQFVVQDLDVSKIPGSTERLARIHTGS